MCASATYANIANFEWYIDTLIELAYFALTLQDSNGPISNLGETISNQLIDVTARVKTIRSYAVKKMAIVLGDETFLEIGDVGDAAEVLGAAAWICGEYCR